MRFEPGERKTVGLVEVGGAKVLSGGSGLMVGPFDEGRREEVRAVVKERKFGDRVQEKVEEGEVPSMNREVVSQDFDTRGARFRAQNRLDEHAALETMEQNRKG